MEAFSGEYTVGKGPVPLRSDAGQPGKLLEGLRRGYRTDRYAFPSEPVGRISQRSIDVTVQCVFNCLRVGGSFGRKPRVRTPAPSGSETASSGVSLVPSMISIVLPPISSSSRSPADQPYQRRTAR